MMWKLSFKTLTSVVLFAALLPASADASNPLFLPAVPYSPGGQQATAVAVADLNGDGKPDVAAVAVNYYGESNGDGSVAVLLGNGDGSFKPAVVYDSGGGDPTDIAVADLNHDGKLDLVVVNQGCPTTNSSCLGVLLGNGDGTFKPVVVYASGGRQEGSDGEATFQIVIDDLNGDGNPDLVVINQTGSADGNGTIGILMGKGDGSFDPVVVYDSGGYTNSFAVADLNGDGRPDVVVTNWSNNGVNCSGNNEVNELSVGVLLGKGDGTLGPLQSYCSGGGGSTSLTPVVVADVNGDGKPDLLVGNYDTPNGDGSVGVLLGKGDGTFQAAVAYDSGDYAAESIVAADVNGDGKLDLVVGNGSAGVLLGNGDGTFQPVHTYATAGALYVLVADVDGDGKPDLVTINNTSSSVSVLLNNGDGTFAQEAVFYSGGALLSGLAIADVNGDGRPDLVAANWGNANNGIVGILLNNTGPHSPTTTALASSIDPVVVGKSVTYTATVTNQSGGSMVGTITFQDGGSTIATVPLSGNQATTFIAKLKPVGAHPITATYSGDTADYGSSSTLTEYVRGPSKMELTTSGSPSHVGQPVTFTATLTSHYGEIPDGEPVTFSDGKTLLGTVALSKGVAVYTTSSLSAKTHNIKAAYAGDQKFGPITHSVKQVVEQ